MTTFTRAAVAIATSATLILAPMSAAHASSFGSSSNGTAVAPVDPPKQPVEETPAPVDTDAQVAEKFRAAFVEAFENSGGVENAAATKVAQDVAEEAAAGELHFVQADADGLYYTHEGIRSVDGSLYGIAAFRVAKNLGNLAVDFLDTEGQDAGVAGPFGVAVEYNEDYYFITATIKAL